MKINNATVPKKMCLGFLFLFVETVWIIYFIFIHERTTKQEKHISILLVLLIYEACPK